MVKTHGKKKALYDDGGLVFTYAEARAMGISTSQFLFVMNKLIEVGLVDLQKQGGMAVGDINVYAISGRWRAYGTEAFRRVEKSRTLWLGHDVRSNMQKKIATENRRGVLRKSVPVYAK